MSFINSDDASFKTFTLRQPDDMHVHLRDGEMLKQVLFFTETAFARALVMPNLPKPVLTGADAMEYKKAILACRSTNFEPLMTIKLVASTTPAIIKEAMEVGVLAGKFYPEGVTTNSADGVRDVETLYPIFEAMEKHGMVLSLHGEEPGAFCLDREMLFLRSLEAIAEKFPQLKIVLEHITTEAAASMVRSLPDNVAATITVHHLILTLDDVIGDAGIQVHHFCKPIPKKPGDRDQLVEAVLSGNPKFFLGTDSAPHAVGKKECSHGCAGVFSAPVALEVLAEVFEKHDALPKMEAFTSEFGARFYGLPLNERPITLRKEEWDVPDFYGYGGFTNPVVPFKAGGTLTWRLPPE